MRKALLLLLALCLPACGVGTGAQGPYVPPGAADMAMQQPQLEQVQPGPDSSGKDVRLLWVKSDGGARVRLGQKVHAVELSQAVGAPVQCAFEESGVDGSYACVPTGPVAVLLGSYYFDPACTVRIFFETPEWRSCFSPAPIVGTYYTAAQGSSTSCVNKARTYTLKRITTPQLVYFGGGGKCITHSTGATGNNYYVLDKDVTALLPTGRLGVE